MEDNTPTVPPFTAQTGMNVELPENATPYDFVKLFFTEELWTLLVTETNRFAQQYLAQHGATLPTHSRLRKWVPTTVPEMKIFMALHLLMGIIVKPEIEMYWSRLPLVSTPIFSSSMSRDRWCVILTFFHLADNEQANAEDKLTKLRPLIDLMLARFRAVYTPSREVSIDEELVAWRGRLQFRQFIPSKRARFGIKVFALCESSGYMANFIVYVGKDDSYDPDMVRELGKSGAVVGKLMQPYNNKGYHLYVDNWYTSVPLAHYLVSHGTAMCGTVRKNRHGLPKRLTANRTLSKGEFIFRSSNGLLCVKLSDTKEVHFLSSIHAANVVATGKRDHHRLPVHKLALVHDYNLFMGGVDRNDEMVSFYTAARKTHKWYVKLATHLLDEGMLNAFILHKKYGTQRKKHTEFVLSALDDMLRDGRETAGAAAAVHPATPVSLQVAFARHVPAQIPPTAGTEKPQKRCRVCWRGGVRRETSYCCMKCPGAPGLCPAPCFGLYHQ